MINQNSYPSNNKNKSITQDQYYNMMSKMDEIICELKGNKNEIKGIKEVNSMIINSKYTKITKDEEERIMILDKDYVLNLKIKKNVPIENTYGMLTNESMKTLLTDKDTQSDIN